MLTIRILQLTLQGQFGSLSFGCWMGPQGWFDHEETHGQASFLVPPIFPPSMLAELTQKLRPLVLELREFDPKLIDIVLCILQ